MKRIVFGVVAVAALIGAVAYVVPASSHSNEENAPIVGIKIPPGYRDWKLISVAHEAGNLNVLRAIWVMTWQSRPTGKGRFHFRTAPS